MTDPTLEQIEADYQSLAQANSKLLKEAEFAKQMYTNGKLEQYRGCSIVISNQKIIAVNDSSLLALREGVRIAGSDNVYLVFIDNDDEYDW